MIGSPGARAASARLVLGGYTGRGYFVTLFCAFVLVLGGVGIAFATWSQDRYVVAHDLYQSGAEAQAHDAEVYYRSCKGCGSEFRAVVEYPGGPRTLPDLPSISFDRDGLPKGRWVVAPPPYDRTFQVLYDPGDPTDPGTIMTVDDVEDEVYQDGPLMTWVVVGPKGVASTGATGVPHPFRSASGDRDLR